MSLGERDRRVVWQATQDRQTRRLRYRLRCRAQMPVTADSVENDTSESYGGLHELAAKHQSSRGSAHARDVQHQDDRTVQGASHRGRARMLRPAYTVEQTHHPLDYRHARVARAAAEHAAEGALVLQPHVEIARGATGSLSVEPRIDVIGPGLEGCRAKPLTAPRGQEAEGDARLAHRAVGSRQKNARAHRTAICSTRPSAVRLQRLDPLTNVGVLSARL